MVALVAFLGLRQGASQEYDDLPATTTAAPPDNMPVEASQEEPVATGSSIADLQLALDAAIEMRQAAERKLLDSERDVEELEAYLDEIEARGEDPVDYADEGMEKFQPAFFAWQDAMQELEQAELIEAEARRALSERR